jgi:hypothetical protein
MNIGTGNYNRFAPLQPPPIGRSRINSKRKYDDDSPPLEPKTPRLDANLVFSQLKASDEAVSEIRKTLNDAVALGESCYSATDGGMGEAFFKLAKTVDLLIANQEKVLSTVVDAMGVLDKSSAPAASGRGKNIHSASQANYSAVPSPAELKVKKLRQAITKAERAVTLFDLDLGSVPVLNRETLSKKVTLVLTVPSPRVSIRTIRTLPRKPSTIFCPARQSTSWVKVLRFSTTKRTLRIRGTVRCARSPSSSPSRTRIRASRLSSPSRGRVR